MSILLTGGAGYIGSHTASVLLEQGRDVVIADDFSNSSPKVIERLEKLAGRPVPFRRADVTSAAELERVFSEFDIDAVIHFAGLKAVGESVREPLRYYRSNIDSSLTLLETMARFGVHRLIFSSSATVYGVPERLPYREGDPVGPCLNPYGWTKLMIEQIITDAAAADASLRAVLLRYFNPVGAHPSGLIGEMPGGTPNNLMPYITQVAVGKLPRLNIFGDDYDTPDGTGVRDYIHVMDLARGHAAALDWCDRNSGVEVFNLGAGRGSSVREVVAAFERASGTEIPCAVAPRREGDLPAYWADAEKAERLLGWRAELSLEDMCRDSWNWQSKNPDGYK